MKWFGPTAEVEILEESESLLIRVKSLHNWPTVGLGLLFVGFVNYGFIKDGQLWVIVLFDLAMAFEAYRLHKPTGETQELSATATYLWSSTHGRMRWEELSYLRFMYGGEDEPTGLYAKRQSSRICLLEGLDKDQGEDIAQRIFTRFPFVPMADDDGPPSIFGQGSDPISLGLSKRDS